MAVLSGILVILVVLLAIFVLVIVPSSLRICSEWERKVVLRLGRFTVDMIVFRAVVNPEWAAIRVADYRAAVLGGAQAALRDVIGRTNLADLLSDRQSIDVYLARTLDEQTEPWGVKVASVQIRDIQIPASLTDAMSRYAQAERESAARVLLGASEEQVAQSFANAARVYASDPNGMQLRGMNMLFEVMKAGNGTVILVPSSALDNMNLGGLAALGGSAAGV